MLSELPLYIGALLSVIWGVAHLLPTRNVVSGFGDITADNKNIITMEWIVEGVSLLFIGLLISVVTWIDSSAPVSIAVYGVTAAALLVLAAVSFFTGFKVNFLPFKMCPFVLALSALLIAMGGIV